MKGVNENSPYPKVICIANSNIANYIEPKVLYDVEMTGRPEGKKGFIVVSATPHTFEARIETQIIKNSVYNVTIKFGNKTIIFDPLDGEKDCVRTISGVKEILESRRDLKNQSDVIEEFLKTANIVLLSYKEDGYTQYRDWETDRKSTRLNSSHSAKSRMPSSA